MPQDRSLGARMTAKVGPLPVWLWAILILGVGYLIYRSRAGSTPATTTTSTPPDATIPSTDQTTSGTPAADNTGGGTSDTQVGLNDQILSQLSGMQGQLDDLTAALLSSQAIPPGAGHAGAGANDGSNALTYKPPVQEQPSGTATTPPHQPPVAKPKPVRKPPAPRARPRRPATTPVSGYNRRTVARLH